VQVIPTGVRVLAASLAAPCSQEIHLNLPVDVGGLGAAEGVQISSVSIEDPYLLLRLSDGAIRVLRVDPAFGDLVVESPLPLDPKDPVTACSLYRDDGTLERALFTQSNGKTTSSSSHHRMFAVTVHRSGTLSVFLLPTFTRVFLSRGIHVGTGVLSSHSEDESMFKDRKKLPKVFISEILLQRVSPGCLSLTAITCNDDLYVYLLGPALHLPKTSVRSPGVLGYQRANSSARFVRPPTLNGIVTRRPDPETSTGNALTGVIAIGSKPISALEEARALYSPARLIPLKNINGWNAIAVLTPSPVYLLGHLGGAHLVPMYVPDVTGAAGSTAIPGDMGFLSSPITACSSFHSESCDRGMVLAHNGYVQFCVLPPYSATQVNAPSGLLTTTSLDPMTAGSLDPPLETPYVPSKRVNPLIGAALARGSSKIEDMSPPLWTEIAQGDQASSEPFVLDLIRSGASTTIAYRYHQSKTQCQLLTPTVRRLTYLEATSNAIGTQALQDWLAAATSAAISRGAPPPLPPTASQAACSVFPLYLAGVSIPSIRNQAKELAAVLAELEAEGTEYSQIDYGMHKEFASEEIVLEGTEASKERDEALKPLIDLGLRAPAITDELHVLRIYSGSSPSMSSASWVCHGEHALLTGEKVLSCMEIPLMDYATAAATNAPPKQESCIVVGTGFVTPRGEDAAGEGRILIFRVIKKVQLPSSGEQSSLSFPIVTLKCIHEQTMHVPISCMAPLLEKGVTHIIAGSGRTLQVLEWHRGTATPVNPIAVPTLRLIARYESNLWIRDVSVAANYVLFSDFISGLQFLRWREEDHNLLPLAREESPLCPGGPVDMVILDKTLGLVGFDWDGNVCLYHYAPKDAGSRLVPKADFKASNRVTKVSRVRFAFSPGTPPAARRRFTNVLFSSDGGISNLIPIDELTFKRLLALQKLMLYTLPHVACLNPKSWRLFAPNSSFTAQLQRPRMKNILDASLLFTFLTLDARMQLLLAKAIGSTIDRILDNFRSIDLCTFIC
jgi:CPSF A subunit region